MTTKKSKLQELVFNGPFDKLYDITSELIDPENDADAANKTHLVVEAFTEDVTNFSTHDCINEFLNEI
jgi:hypothetical protein